MLRYPDPPYGPPQYPSGTLDPYKDGPSAYDGGPPIDPIQKWALPTDPNGFMWVRGVGCVIMAPGTNPAVDHDWNDPTKYLILPLSTCTQWAASLNIKLPEYQEGTGLPDSYINEFNPAVPYASPQPVYSYTVPYATDAKWSCDAAAKVCLQNVVPTSTTGFVSKSACDLECGSFSCVNKQCMKTDKFGDPFLTMTACINSGCGMWACKPGVAGKCELSDKGSFADQASCEASAQCAGLNTTNDTQCYKTAAGTCAASAGYNPKTCALYADQCFSTTGPQCTKDSQCKMVNGKYVSDTGSAYWCQYISTLAGSGMFCANPPNQCQSNSQCSFGLSGCTSKTGASAKCAWTGYFSPCTCSRAPPH